MNIPLKQALSIHSTPAYRVAKQIGRSPGWLSMVVQEMATPSDIEKGQIAKILGHSVGELFPVQARSI